MKKITYIYIINTIFFFTISNLNANILEYDNNITCQENMISDQESSLSEVINSVNKSCTPENSLSRRKGEIKYSDLKMYWKHFIKNLDKKRQNPDRVMLDKRRVLA